MKSLEPRALDVLCAFVEFMFRAWSVQYSLAEFYNKWVRTEKVPIGSVTTHGVRSLGRLKASEGFWHYLVGIILGIIPGAWNHKVSL